VSALPPLLAVACDDVMPWIEPLFSRAQVNWAGGYYAGFVPWAEDYNPQDDDMDKLEKAYEIINNWRSSHSFPLNTFRVTLARNAQKVDRECLVAQRLKRLSSIDTKLSRFRNMKLSQMQDIGGCRAVVSTVDAVYKLVDIYKKSEIKHTLHEVYD
jgi:ppGpp synthetase/RelA/SpoT-type nucleotidyltranferase